MKYSQLGNSTIRVSKICLGTMTFGHQNSMTEAHEQLDLALDYGVNFIDTAEMYPVPPKAETFTVTEQYIGHWLKNRKDREKIYLATKILGPRDDIDFINRRYNREHLTSALEGSLKRLQTDYIDLYQLHWPERKTNNFGKLGFSYEPDDKWESNTLEVLHLFGAFIKSGKIKHIGLSNETPWGVHEFLKLSEIHQLPRIVSIQNPYSLVNRSYEIGLAEISLREKVGLLAYSPLAFGMLTGKYDDGVSPPNARITLFKKLSRYSGDPTRKAAKLYNQLARDYNLSPAQMALAYVNSRPYLTSNIIGATTRKQLEENIQSLDIMLPSEVIQEIERIHLQNPNPAP